MALVLCDRTVPPATGGSLRRQMLSWPNRSWHPLGWGRLPQAGEPRQHKRTGGFGRRAARHQARQLARAGCRAETADDRRRRRAAAAAAPLNNSYP
eukprot:scaffold2221_cov368-Prasinococcus_capsulatus_cf.AAC.6